MKQILVPIDFSDNSVKAAKYAIGLAKKLMSELTLLYAYEVRQRAGTFKDFSQVLEENANTEMEQLVKKLKADSKAVRLKWKTTQQAPVDAIVHAAEKGNFDLVVMGTKGASGLKEVFVGSVAGGVISNTKTPVIVVPGEAEYAPPELIVFGVGGTPLSSPEVLKPLIAIAEAYQSDLTILHLDEQKNGLNDVLELLKHLNTAVMYGFQEGKVDQRINEYVANSDADMLCLIRQNRSFFERVFKGSVTLKQTFHSKVPLLVLHN